MAKWKIKYTGRPGRTKRPYIEVVLRFAGKQTPGHPMVVDTGSDRCMFNEQLARDYLDINPAMYGMLDKATGLSGTDDVAVFPHLEVFLPELKRSFIVSAQFKFLLFPGVIGHEGVLNQLKVTFHHGEYFEIDDSDHP